MYNIFVIMGKSATGKDTIYKNLIDIKSLNLKKVVSYTTRPIRTSEKNGEEYFFVSEDEFRRLDRDKKIIEKRTYNTVFGEWHYFTAYDGQIDLKHSNFILIGTLESYNSIKKYYGEDVVRPIYIEVDDFHRLERAIARESYQKNPNYKELCRRYIADDDFFSDKKILMAGITKTYVNNDIRICIDQIIDDIQFL